MKLYEIEQQYLDVFRLIENGDIPEEAIADTLESMDCELTDKLDNIACYIKSLKAEAEAIDQEEKRLKERKEAKTKKADRLTEYISQTLLTLNKTKVETARNVLSFRKSASLYIEDESEIINVLSSVGRGDLLDYKTTIRKQALKEEIKNGMELDGVKIVEKQNLQIK